MFTWGQLLSSYRINKSENNNSEEIAVSRDNKRLVPYSENERNNDDIIAFDSDYKRIVTSPSFRRLQDKTQVFPLERHDFVHTRLTHSIEVAMLARELASRIMAEDKKTNETPSSTKIPLVYKERICRILESASLLHDIGNPPFGHFGEDIIRHWFDKNLPDLLRQKKLENINIDNFIHTYLNDFTEFDGNAQALRIVTKLHYFSGEPGMHLTAATVNTIIKYTRSADEPNYKSTQRLVDKKIGYFKAEQDIFQLVTQKTGVGQARHPLTFILEAADDIAYLTADIEDALKKELFSFDFFKAKMVEFNQQPSELNARFLEDVIKSVQIKQTENQEEFINQCFFYIRQKLIYAASFSFNYHYDEIMQGCYNSDLFKQSYAEKLHDFLGHFAIKHIFSNKHILKLEISGHTILTFLLNKFVTAVLPYPDLTNIDNKLDKKVISLISESHKQIYTLFAAKHQDNQEYLLYLRLLMVTDFISGMTDSYAQDLYTTLSGYHL